MPQTTQVSAVPAQKIEVQFSQQSVVGSTEPQYTFKFTPTVLTLPSTGGSSPTTYTVVFDLVSNIPGATITSEDTLSGTPPSGLQPSGSGSQQLTITFSNSGLTQSDTLNYEITVNLPNGQSYTSSDPEIIIPPPN